MSTYKNLRGKRIKFFTSDLDNAEGEGQVFYSDTDSEYKVAAASGAFTSGGPLSTGRFSSAGAGTQTACLIAGGYSTGPTDITEEYNGSGWATGGTLNTA